MSREKFKRGEFWVEIFFLALAVVFALLFLLAPDNRIIPSLILPISSGLIVPSCIIPLRLFKGERIAIIFKLLLLASSLFFIAECIGSICFFFNLKNELCSFIIGFLMVFGYLVTISSALKMIRFWRIDLFSYKVKLFLNLVLPALIICFILTVAINLIFPEIGGRELLFFVGYSFLDIFLVTTSLILLSIFLRMPLISTSLLYLSLGLILLSSSDVAYVVISLLKAEFFYPLIVLGWSYGYMLLALGMIRHRFPEIP